MMHSHALSTASSSPSSTVMDMQEDQPLSENKRKREDALWRTLTESDLMRSGAPRSAPSLGSVSEDRHHEEEDAPGLRIDP
jgi:hypothetical protein